MKTSTYVAAFLCALTLWGCYDVEDPGPLQEITREYAALDFDQLEMGSGLRITVEEGDFFRVAARGDRRNINDLEVYTTGNTLRIEYKDQGNRRHDTYITIEMPVLRAVNFSGGSISTINGFESDGIMNCYLSGGSTLQMHAGYRILNVVLSGASMLRLHGLGDALTGEISGSSVLNAFDYPVSEALLNLSGASSARVLAADALKIHATGASTVVYRGNPVVEKNISGASTVRRD